MKTMNFMTESIRFVLDVEGGTFLEDSKTKKKGLKSKPASEEKTHFTLLFDICSRDESCCCSVVLFPLLNQT